MSNETFTLQLGMFGDGCDWLSPVGFFVGAEGLIDMNVTKGAIIGGRSSEHGLALLSFLQTNTKEDIYSAFSNLMEKRVNEEPDIRVHTLAGIGDLKTYSGLYNCLDFSHTCTLLVTSSWIYDYRGWRPPNMTMTLTGY